MSEFASSYTSTNVENGITFDELVGSLLAYKPDQWGYTEQDYNNINSDFGVDSNSLYYLPAGNYKMENIPDFPINADFVNVSVFDQGAKKLIYCNAGGKERYSTELSSATDSVVWNDITNTAGDGTELILIHVGDTEPVNTSMMWVDTSKLISENRVSFKYNDGTNWVSYSFNGIMLQDVYDTEGLKKDPYAAVMTSLEAYVGDYANFIRHKNNELTLIHLASDERDFLDEYLLTTTEVADFFAVGSDLYNQLLALISTWSDNATNCSANEATLNDANEEFDVHVNGRCCLTDGGLFTRGWQSVCYGKDKYVAVAYNSNYFAYSTDGITWTEGTISSNSRNWISVCYGKDKYVATTDSNYFAYSTDGITWTEGTISSKSRQWHSVCYGDGKFVAVTYDDNYFAYSTDGITWTEGTISDTSRYWRSVCYGKDKFVAVAYYDNYFAYSTDGITWTEGTISSTDRDWYSVCYGKDKFVAVVNYSTKFAYSTDGITWTEGTISDTSRGWNSVCYGNGKFVAISGSEGYYDSVYIAYSYDGIRWTETPVSNPLVYYTDITSVCYGNDKFVCNKLTTDEDYENVVCTLSYFTDIYSYIAPHIVSGKSTEWDAKAEGDHTHNLDDKVTINGDDIEAFDSVWRETNKIENLPDYIYDKTSNIYRWRSICYGTDKFVAVAGTVTALSTDGINWEYGTSFDKFYGDNIYYADGKFVIFGEYLIDSSNFIPACIYSEDGINWSSVATIDASKIASRIHSGCHGCYGDGKFVVITDVYDGFRYLYYSTDLTTWTYTTKYFENSSANSICYGNGKFIVVGDNNRSFYSSDLVNWESNSIYINEYSINWESICYADNKFVAVGGEYYHSSYYGYTIYSIDGITWESGISKFYNEYYNSVCYGDGKFVAVSGCDSETGFVATSAYSYDGINWIKQINYDSQKWYNVCYGNGVFVTTRLDQRGISDRCHFQYSYMKELTILSEDKLPVGLKERAYLLDSLDVLATAPSAEDLADKYHNGNTVYTEDINGNSEWWKIVDNTKFGQEEDLRVTTITDINTDTSIDNTQVIACAASDTLIIAIEYNVIENRLTTALLYSTDGITWTEGTISNTKRYWHSVCYGNGKYVAVAQNSKYFAYSTDGITWTEGTISSTNRKWYSVCYGNGKYVAVVWKSNYFAYSTDGITWTEGTISSTSRQWYSVCYGNDKFVTVAESTTYFAYSTDGITWTEGTISSTSRNWWSICYGDGKFVAVGHSSNYFAYSTDGITWTEGTISSTDRRWASVCYGNGKYVAVAYDSNYFAYSTDGITWTEVETKSLLGSYAYNICYYSNKYIYTASLDDNSNIDHAIIIENAPIYKEGLRLLSSTNSNPYFEDIKNKPTTLEGYGITDAVSTSELEVLNNEVEDAIIYSRVIYPADGFDGVAVYAGIQKTLNSTGGGTEDYPMSTDTSDLDVIVGTSIDGTFSSSAAVVDKINCEQGREEFSKWKESKISDTSRGWRSVYYGKDKYVAVASDSKYFAYSTDGITWTEGTISGSSRNWYSVCYGNCKYVAVAYGSTIFAYSTDGITWTEGTISDTSRKWESVCYGKDKFVAVAKDTTYFAYSTDGITWTEGTISSTSRYWYSICYGNDKYVAVTYNDNYFAYSTDGITWTEGNISRASRNWESVCYGKDKFVAVSRYTTYFAYSTDGITWTEGTISSTSREWHSVCYGNGKYVAVADISKYFAYSTDGITWTEGTISDTSRRWYSVCYGKDKFVTFTYLSNYFAYSRAAFEMPAVDAGMSLVETDINGGTYFNSLYSSDSANPKWSSDGLGRMIKYSNLDINGTLIDTTYTINGKEYHVKVVWDTTKGLVAEVRIDRAVTGAVNCIDNMITYEDSMVYAVDSYAKLLHDSGAEIVVNEWPRMPNIRTWWSVCYGKDKFVTIANNSNYFAYSTDGITWTEGTISDTSRTWESVCYGKDKFVAVLWNSNYFAYSTDGITWTEGTISDTSRWWHSVCYGNDKFVTIEYSSNYFAYSTDGITWTEGTISSKDRRWRSVCYGKDKFVAVARDTNYFAYSTDGITWTEGTISSTNRKWESVCYGNDKYVAVADNTNYFAYSTDGITWTEGTISSTSRGWSSVCYGNDKFVAIVWDSNYFAYSYDGITWTEGTISSTSREWYSVCYGKDKYVAVAEDNYFATLY